MVNLALRDNPLGHAAAERLIRAVQRKPISGALKQVDLMGCGLAPAAGSSTKLFNPNEPDGSYDLDVAVPAQRQVWIEWKCGCSGSCLETGVDSVVWM